MAKQDHPTAVIARRVRELRERRGITAAQLSERMRDVGTPFDKTVVANLETGRRRFVTVQELLALAYILDVAPVHLLLPIDDERASYAYTPNRNAEVWRVREWVRGHPYAAAPTIGLGGVDPRKYLSEVPAVESIYPPKQTSPLHTTKVVEPDSTSE